ncbi:ABC transporter permease subunit [Ligilactobacillus sp. WILCCON 0076]|uniref:ABC transporter permease subunit n=1 Tax=Ligilactobacillus ubinensis TaxID=2876789 RepID=A0A9X2FMQ9_9LACO|nr:ABC transporter permease subunit [Ligilactobacillus ubinensis]MCP0887183.1 ABC transporter permease subunit [Ligilactobacillus ubinensis]
MEETKSKNKINSILMQLLPWTIPVALIILWQIAVDVGWITSSFIPSPLSVLANGVSLWKSGELPKNISISLYRALVGFAIGGGLGFILGFLNGVSKVMRALFDTTIQMLRNIPHLALIPVVILVLGIGETAKISLVAIGCLFPMYINTYHGITSVDPHLIEMGKSYGLSKYKLFSKVIFPGALPTILMGVRYALGVMWTTLIVAETVSADSGIGYMSTNAQQFMNMKTIFLCIIIYAILGKLSDFIAKTLENILLDWR